MGEQKTAGGKALAILVLLATIATIALNGLASTGYIGGVTPAVISEKYQTLITPAGYAFSIWSLIYLGLIGFSIYQVLPQNHFRFNNIRVLYLVTCIFNCAWIFLWHYEMIPLSLVAISALLTTLFLINRQLVGKSDSLGDFWAVKAPFSLYFGWVTAATLVNFTIMLKYLQLDFTPATWTVLGAGTILLAATAAVYIRYRLSNYLYPLAIAWALAAIGVKQSGQTWIVVATALGTIVSLIASLSFIIDLPNSGNSDRGVRE